MAYRYYAELKLSCLNCGQVLTVRTASHQNLKTTVEMVAAANLDEVEHGHSTTERQRPSNP